MPSEPDAGSDAGGEHAGHPPADAGAANPFVVEHNRVRAQATPPPNPPLAPLQWSAQAAQTAQAWADNCSFQHNAGRGDLGENLYATTVEDVSAATVVEAWASEVSHYDYASNTCSNVCGHYTQIVWRDTTHVGCGTARCTTNSPFGGGPWTLVVCNYSPPGNFVGERPY